MLVKINFCNRFNFSVLAFFGFSLLEIGSHKKTDYVNFGSNLNPKIALEIHRALFKDSNRPERFE